MEQRIFIALILKQLISAKILNCGSNNINGIFFDNVYADTLLTSGIGFRFIYWNARCIHTTSNSDDIPLLLGLKETLVISGLEKTNKNIRRNNPLS